MFKFICFLTFLKNMSLTFLRFVLNRGGVIALFYISHFYLFVNSDFWRFCCIF